MKTYPKGKLTFRQRKSLPSRLFVFPKKRSYPIENETHARNALSRVSRYGTQKQKEKVCKAVEKRYPEIHAESCTMHGEY
jgi:hypothetical protein